jgi:hypothetical protein
VDFRRFNGMYTRIGMQETRCSFECSGAHGSRKSAALPAHGTYPFHGAACAEEYGCDRMFKAPVARIVADFVTNFDPDRTRARHGTGKGTGK